MGRNHIRICRLLDRTGIGYSVDERGDVILDDGSAVLYCEDSAYALVVGQGDRSVRSELADTAAAFESIKSWWQAKLNA